MKTILTLAAAALAAVLSLSAHAVGRLADISVHDRSTGRELPVHWHDGKPYVVGRPGNEYQVVVRNRTDEDLLAVVSVDGVNVLSGETAGTQQGGYVVSARERMGIAGWRKSLGETAAFYFTSLGDSYAARTGRPANIGVIGVALYQRKQTLPPSIAPQAPHDYWSRSERDRHMPESSAPAPAQESRAEKRAQAAGAAPLGTGHGRREDSAARYVNFERRTREPVEVVAIHYDSYRNLVAQGILAAPRRTRDPNPFPTRFVPDP